MFVSGCKSKKLQNKQKMKHRTNIKKILKILFFLIQALIFVFSIGFGLVSFTVYFKARKLFLIPFSTFLLFLSIMTVSFFSSLIGLQILNSKKKIKVFIFIILSLVLINLQFILAIKSSLLPEKSLKWGDNIWEIMTDYQRKFIEDKFKCCGYKKTSDRNSKDCLSGDTGCLSVIYDLSVNLRSVTEKSIIFLIFAESLGLGIGTLLKLRK